MFQVNPSTLQVWKVRARCWVAGLTAEVCTIFRTIFADEINLGLPRLKPAGQTDHWMGYSGGHTQDMDVQKKAYRSEADRTLLCAYMAIL